MIEPMKHITIFAMSKMKRIMLVQLRKLGVLHLVTKSDARDISPLIEHRYTTCKQALDILKNYTPPHAEPMAIKHHDSEYGHRVGEVLAAKAIAVNNELTEHKQELFRVRRLRSKIEPWGAYDYHAIKHLSEHKVNLRFFEITKKELMESNIRNYQIINTKGRVRFVVVVDYGERQDIPYREIELSEIDASSLDARIQQLRLHIMVLQNKLKAIAHQHLHIIRAWQRIANMNQIAVARETMNWSGDIVYISGFIPECSLDKLKTIARKMKWGFVCRNPKLEELPPSKLKTNWFVKMVHPLYRMLGTLPGYYEPDSSPVFLLFFVLFFAMIIGDAGYAALLIPTALVLWIRGARTKRPPLVQSGMLLTTVGIATLVWGAVSGNWFGSAYVAQRAPLSQLVVPQLFAFDIESIPLVQWLCFVIAVVHLSIARLWKIRLHIHNKQFLSIPCELGWLSLIIGLYGLVVQLILTGYGYYYPPGFAQLLVVGAALIVLFGQQQRGTSVLKGMLKGIANLFNTVLDSISAFADIISYLRLFAVGLASLEIARSFNQIFLTMSDSTAGLIGGIVLLLLGHTLNIAMGALSLIVHGIRLNMLEFSGHLGIEWSGIDYVPYRDIADPS